MNVHHFISSNQDRWKQLEAFVAEASRLSLARVPLEEFRQGSRVYRETVADLGYGRMRFPNHQAVRELERRRTCIAVYQSRAVKR
jgi:hypothetical protein